jgi:hypothetical protein
MGNMRELFIYEDTVIVFYKVVEDIFHREHRDGDFPAKISLNYIYYIKNSWRHRATGPALIDRYDGQGYCYLYGIRR